LRGYYRRYAGIAADNNVGMVLEAPTWRASRASTRTAPTRAE
jgi:hypothetical protein